ncbi:MAG: hypothetical protein WA874_19755 [Chryseosolibacter sp.]
MRTPILLLAGLCISTSMAIAQESEPLSRTIFKLSPQHFIHNSLKAGVERFNQNHTGSVAVFLTGRLESKQESAFDDGYNGLAGELQFRKYISPMKALTSKHGKAYYQGIYGAAYLQGGSYSGEFRDEYSYYDPNTGQYVTQYQYDYHESVGNWGLGFTIGYQKTLWQVIFMEAFIGGGIQFSDKTTSGNPPAPDTYDYSGIVDPDYKGILPKIGLHIGIGL